MNKRRIAITANLITVLTVLTAHLPQLLPFLPQKWQAVVPGILAAALHTAEFFAPPTPSPIAESQKVSIAKTPDGASVISPVEPPK